jgi:hypothetical protein
MQLVCCQSLDLVLYEDSSNHWLERQFKSIDPLILAMIAQQGLEIDLTF